MICSTNNVRDLFAFKIDLNNIIDDLKVYIYIKKKK